MFLATPGHVAFIKGDKVTFLTVRKAFLYLLERVGTKKLFVLFLIELDHRGINGGTNGHQTGLLHEFLSDKGLTPQQSCQLVSVICTVSIECSHCEKKIKEILFEFGNCNTQDIFFTNYEDYSRDFWGV